MAMAARRRWRLARREERGKGVGGVERRGGSSFDEISRKTTDEVLKKLKTTTKGKAALGALGFSAVFLALIWATVE